MGFKFLKRNSSRMLTARLLTYAVVSGVRGVCLEGICHMAGGGGRLPAPWHCGEADPPGVRQT